MGQTQSHECSCSNFQDDRQIEQYCAPTPQYSSYLKDAQATVRKQPIPYKYQNDTTAKAVGSSLNQKNSNQKATQVLRVTQTLLLEVIASSTLQNGKILQICDNGLIGGLRNMEDGITYFGSKKRSQKGKFNQIINDSIIPSIDSEFGERHRGNHFYIRFDQHSNTYKIKDQGLGFGLFRQIEQSQILKDNLLLNTGLLFFTVNTAYGNYTQMLKNTEMQNLTILAQQGLQCFLDYDDGFQTLEVVDFLDYLNQNSDQIWSFLKLSFFGGHSKQEKFLFATNISRGVITIGRDSENMISYSHDTLLSKFQCVIYYDGTSGWILEDQKSTNGVWIYVCDELKITNGMRLKANHSMFQVTLQV